MLGSEIVGQMQSRLARATEFLIGSLSMHPVDSVTIRRCNWAVPNQPYMWKVCWMDRNLTKQGGWEYEPMASGRDIEFYDRCRFDTLDEAWEAAENALRKGR